jgi:PRC-barrel domain
MATLKTELTSDPLGRLDSSHHLIESDRVEGTAVLDRDGVKIGTIVRLMIDKLLGQVRYAVMESGGFLGVGESYHPLPWDILNFNPEEGAYVVDLDRDRLAGAPSYSRTDEPDWRDPAYGARVRDYYGLAASRGTSSTL